VQRGAIGAGAYGMVISGAGPTLLALCDRQAATGVEAAMTEAWAEEGVSVTTRVLQVDVMGAIVE
jgi:homoserine kinase